MRKTIATVIILGLVWIGYTAWPIYDLLVLLRAMETRDIETVTRHVFSTRCACRTACRCLPAAHRYPDQSACASMAAAAPGIADPVAKKLISPEALSELMAVGWPITVVSDPPPGTIGITWNTVGTIWQIFGNSEYGLARFEVTAPFASHQQQRFRLTFRLFQWRWRLVAVTLPENIQKLLGDELAKVLGTPVQNR